MNVKWVGCAIGNFRTGRSGHKIEAIVIHLMDGSIGSCDNWFNTALAAREAAGWKKGPSSAHYGGRKITRVADVDPRALDGKALTIKTSGT